MYEKAIFGQFSFLCIKKGKNNKLTEMPNIYKDSHLVDEFGRIIPYDGNFNGLGRNLSAEQKKDLLESSNLHVNDGAYVSGNRVKEYIDDTYGFYGEVSKKNEGRKLYVGDIHASYNKEVGIGTISTKVINDRNDIKEQPRFISSSITESQFNQYMGSNDEQRLRLAAEYLPGIRLESTKSRVVQVGNIDVTQQKEGSYIMSANIDGEQIRRTVSEQQRDKFMALDADKREKLFAKVFDCKGVCPEYGSRESVSEQIMNGMTGNTVSTNIVSAGADGKNAVIEKTASMNISELSQQNFEQIVQETPEKTESLRTSLSR